MEIAYLEDGREVELIGEAQEGYLVRDVVQDDFGEPISCEQIYWVKQVWSQPPLNIYAEQVVELKSEIQRLKARLADEQDRLAEVQAQQKHYQKYDLLKHFDALVEGKITHFVIYRWDAPEILTVEEILKWDRHDWARGKMPLLSLFGNGKGELTWRLSRYNDGSGEWYSVIPCISYEEAVAIVQKWLDEELQKSNKSRSGAEALIKLARQHELPIPDEFVLQHQEEVRANRQKDVDHARKCLAEAEAKLAEVSQ